MTKFCMYPYTYHPENDEWLIAAEEDRRSQETDEALIGASK